MTDEASEPRSNVIYFVSLVCSVRRRGDPLETPGSWITYRKFLTVSEQVLPTEPEQTGSCLGCWGGCTQSQCPQVREDEGLGMLLEMLARV